MNTAPPSASSVVLRWVFPTLLAVLVAIILAACTATTDDRSEEAGGRNVDEYRDTSDVIVYRNADNIPNVANFCAGGFAYWSTVTTSDNSTGSNRVMGRLSELDSSCPGYQPR